MPIYFTLAEVRCHRWNAEAFAREFKICFHKIFLIFTHAAICAVFYVNHLCTRTLSLSLLPFTWGSQIPLHKVLGGIIQIFSILAFFTRICHVSEARKCSEKIEWGEN